MITTRKINIPYVVGCGLALLCSGLLVLSVMLFGIKVPNEVLFQTPLPWALAALFGAIAAFLIGEERKASAGLLAFLAVACVVITLLAQIQPMSM